mgnify:CR=1 FL=1
MTKDPFKALWTMDYEYPSPISKPFLSPDLHDQITAAFEEFKTTMAKKPKPTMIMTTAPPGGSTIKYPPSETKNFLLYDILAKSPSTTKPVPNDVVEECSWCNDTKRIAWDCMLMGPEPPPADWNPQDAWMWSWHSQRCIDCPRCTDRGWGDCHREPWIQAHRIVKVQDPLASEKTIAEWSKDPFEAARKYVLDWYSKQVGDNIQGLEVALQTARLNYFLSSLQRLAIRRAKEPDWAKWEWDSGPCPTCGSFNFGPATHPRTHEQGIGCCECGGAWTTGLPYPVTDQAEKEVTSFMWGLGIGKEMVDEILSKFTVGEIQQCRGVPMSSRFSYPGL